MRRAASGTWRLRGSVGDTPSDASPALGVASGGRVFALDLFGQALVQFAAALLALGREVVAVEERALLGVGQAGLLAFRA